MKLSLRCLEAFRETVATGSATAAAKRMGLTQPGVSKLIAQLEDELGFDLFYREKGRLAATPDALMLHEEVDLAFGNLERIGNLVRDISSCNTGLLKIVAPPSVSEGLLPAVAARFAKRHPNVRLSIDSRSVETSKALIASRAVDCGFAKLPLGRDDIRTAPLFSARTVCVLPETHPLAALDAITPADLGAEPLVLLGQGSWSRAQIDGAFQACRLIPNVKVETHTVSSACALAGHGLGVAIVNDVLADPYLRGGLIHRAFLPEIVHDYVFMTSSVAPVGRLAEALFQEAQLHLASIGHDRTAVPTWPVSVAKPLALQSAR